MKSKIKFVAYVAASIDGRISESSHSKIDWTSEEDWNFLQKSLKKFDAVVVGSHTYKIAEKSLKKRNTIVFTSKVKKSKVSGSVTFLNPEHSNVRDLLRKNKYRRVAILGGPEVYNFFLKNNMLHELFVTIEPYIFTSGVPMFSGKKFEKYRFKLLSIKKLNGRGTILLRYKNAS